MPVLSLSQTAMLADGTGALLARHWGKQALHCITHHIWLGKFNSGHTPHWLAELEQRHVKSVVEASIGKVVLRVPDDSLQQGDPRYLSLVHHW
jgi:hypothetical protein